MWRPLFENIIFLCDLNAAKLICNIIIQSEELSRVCLPDTEIAEDQFRKAGSCAIVFFTVINILSATIRDASCIEKGNEMLRCHSLFFVAYFLHI